jgi:hypothetical protein
MTHSPVLDEPQIHNDQMIAIGFIPESIRVVGYIASQGEAHHGAANCAGFH